MPDQPLDALSLKHLYDERYAGDYMDTDGYGVWSRQDLGCQRVVETLRQIPGQPKQILDYGCGVGGWLSLLEDLFPNANLSGVDISETAIAKAHDKFPQCRFATFDGARAPFPDASFDLIYTYHVLEHVIDVEETIRDISRLLARGGSACVIFPCGNAGSLEEKIVKRLQGGIIPSPDGRSVWFHEVQFGHLRRMTSAETIALFEQNGLRLVQEWYSPITFGSIDFMCRGSGPWYINRLFRERKPLNRLSGLWLVSVRSSLLMIYRLLQKQSLDLAKRRSLPKQIAVRFVKRFADVTDNAIVRLARWEWRTRRTRRSGSAQYLVFQKF